MSDLIERLEDAWRRLYGDGDEHGVCDAIAEAQAELRRVRDAPEADVQMTGVLILSDVDESALRLVGQRVRLVVEVE